MQTTEVVHGSFRDPRGRVFKYGERIFRTIDESAMEDYRYVVACGCLDKPLSEKRFVASQEVEIEELGFFKQNSAVILEHQSIPFISYPYEWPFPLLKAAALAHLDLQIHMLEYDVALSDATAYNMQFLGVEPIFIDFLSLRKYHVGELWKGHRQFCEQFLNPLLLRSMLGVPHNAWFRGNLEGIPVGEFAKLVPLHRNLDPKVLSHVTLQAKLHRRSFDKSTEELSKISNGELSKSAFGAILGQLKNWIAGLQPKDTGTSVWQDYERANTYSDSDEEEKIAFVRKFVSSVKPKMVWDLGCNTGNYSAAALQAGVDRVIGFDSDHHALELACARASEKKLSLTPLYLDAANPSPDQGWRGREREGVQGRASCADALLALAFEHHLVIGRNTPLEETVAWLVGLAPNGIIEFVHKNDTTVKKMLAIREDIFDNYDLQHFKNALTKIADIVEEKVIGSDKRHLFWYRRHDIRH
jgi:ribosomal protein L11 methylase PrmA